MGARGPFHETWAIRVLLFIEKTQIFDDYDWNTPWFWGGSNPDLLADLVISTYTCPSDGNGNKSS
jgi:hypothetical protein